MEKKEPREKDKLPVDGENTDDAFREETHPPDEPNLLLAIGFFILPLVGLIYSLIKRREKPEATKTYLIVVGVSFLLRLIFKLLM